MTANDELNILASRHVDTILGRRHVFQAAPRRREHEAWWTLPAGMFARIPFSTDAGLAELTARIEKGWRMTGTGITGKFGRDGHSRTYPDAIPLFIVRDGGRIDLVVAGGSNRAREGDTLVALVPPDEKDVATAS